MDTGYRPDASLGQASYLGACDAPAESDPLRGVGYSAVPATAGQRLDRLGQYPQPQGCGAQIRAAGCWPSLFAGITFKPNDVITLYGGALLTERQAREKESEPGGHDYMLRISAKDGSALAFVDGRQFSVDGLSQEPDADGYYLPLPDPHDPEARDARGKQGAGSVVAIRL